MEVHRLSKEGLSTECPLPPLDRGFTLVELMVVMAMMAIFASMAYPSLSQSIANNRVRTQSTEILNIMTFARSEAISRGVVVTVTPSTNWTGSTGTISAGGTVIKRIESLNGSTTISQLSPSFIFDSRGLFSGGAISVSHEQASKVATINITSGGATTLTESLPP